MKNSILILFVILHFISFANPAEDFQRAEKETIEAELKIYPNPARNDRVTISFQSPDISEIRFMDITGKEVIKEIYEFPTQKAVVKISEIPNGIYIVQIKTTQNRWIAKKLMVSKN
jgi:hypothetical protein